MNALAALLALAGAWALAATQCWLLTNHPEPHPDTPDADLKPRYAELLSPATLVVGAPLVAIGLWPLLVVPGSHWPIWVSWAGAVGVLVWVDARTTWLPYRLQSFAESMVLLALAATIWANPGTRGALLAGALLGAVVTAGLFGLVWWFSSALGFGDVRLAAVVGAVTGLGGLDAWYAGVLAATLVGAGWGLIVGWWRRRRPSPLGKVFAYGPALWLGPYLGLAWLQL